MQTIHRILLLFMLVLLPALAHAQPTNAFTYQGRLTDVGSPANGSYDLTFTLFDAGGGLISGPLTNAAVAVNNGLFTTTLNFGSSPFITGADRWLEIAGRTNDVGAFAPLTPRQQITSTPYAITAANVTGDVNASQISGTLSSAQIADSTITSGDIADGTVANADLAADAVTSTKILDLTIVNADISATAAIVDTKLATIATAGKVANSATTATSANTASAIVARNASGNFTAGTITASAYKFPSAQTFVQPISASAFVPDHQVEGYDRGAGLISPSGDTSLQFHAPVNLPDGATVTKITGMFLDVGAEDFTDIDLRLRYFSTASATTYPSTTMAEILDQVTTGFSAGKIEFEDNSITDGVIDNNNRAYSLDVTFTVSSATSNTRFYGVRIEYTHDTLLP